MHVKIGVSICQLSSTFALYRYVASRYPAGTTFTINGKGNWWGNTFDATPEDTLETVLGATENLKEGSAIVCTSTAYVQCLSLLRERYESGDAQHA